MLSSEEGFFLVDKDLTWTSFDVVNKIRYGLKARFGKKTKVGHAGTLDPLASGLLIVCYGKMTKKISDFQDLEKEYTGTIHLGATTPSYDKETEVDQRFEIEHITNEMIQDAATKMIGKQIQVAPIYSAKRIGGVKSYELARKGEDVKGKSNEIEILEFEVNRTDAIHVDFRCRCSKGTYIRSLANDFGKALHSGAYLESLRRTAIGDYKIEDAKTVPEIVDVIDANDN